MSFKLFPLIWGVPSGFLSGTETLVLLKLGDCAQDDGSSVYPSLRRVSKDTKLSIRVIQRSIHSLLTKKMIERVQSFSARMPNIYKINVDLLKNINQDVTIRYENQGCQNNHPNASGMVKMTGESGQNDYPNASGMVKMTGGSGQNDPSRAVKMTTNPLYNPLIEPFLLPADNASSQKTLETSFFEARQNPFSDSAVEQALSQELESGVLEGPVNHGWEESGQEKPVLPKDALAFVGLRARLSAGCSPVGSTSVLKNPSEKSQGFCLKGQGPLRVGNDSRKPVERLDGSETALFDWKKPSVLPLSCAEKPSKGRSSSLGEDLFSKWYAVYPRKVSRKKAYQAFGKAIKRVHFETLLELTRSYAHLVEGQDKQYIPHPATWLSGERWEDVQSSYLFSSPGPMEPIQTRLPEKLQVFVKSHPQLALNAFAFEACEVVQQTDRLILHVPSRFYLDKIDLYTRELEDFFGKPVELHVKAAAPSDPSQQVFTKGFASIEKDCLLRPCL